MKGKIILDACCGSKMFWFDKTNPNTLFADVRSKTHTLCDGRLLEISPDVEHDFRNMPYPDNSFKMVVFDPPHLLKLGKNSWMAKKYGILNPTWEIDLKAGFDECMRVLEPFGTLIFKWNENQIKIGQVLKLIQYDYKPIVGHRSGKSGDTHWLVFMKGLQNGKA